MRTSTPVGLAFLLGLPLALAQTAAPYPPLVYTQVPGSVDPSLTRAITEANGPAQTLLTSSGSNSLTDKPSGFPTTATVGPTAPSSAATAFSFTSASPGEVRSSNTRPPFQATGSISFTSGSSAAPSASARSAAGRTFGGPATASGLWSVAVVVAAGVVAGSCLL